MDAPDLTKFLLLDVRIVAETENTRLTLGKAAKDVRTPLFVEDQPWEVRFDNLYANVIFDRDEKLYKCWYNPFIVDAATTNTPLADRITVGYQPDRQREMGVCYATSTDGIKWEKPALGLFDFDGTRANNLVMRHIHGAGVYKDTHARDVAQRYKAFMRYGVAVSPDGLHWSEVRPHPQIESRWDTHNNLFWDAAHDRYVGFTRLWEGKQRIVGRTESVDFGSWTKAEEVMRSLSDQPHLQTYALIVFPYANLYLGFVMIFDTQDDWVDCELAWSSDTKVWQRLCPSTPMIPRGGADSFDSGCIYAAAYPVLGNNELLLYYGGSNGPHTNWRDTGLGLARLRVDGFAGMEPAAPAQTARIVTQPIVCTGRELQVSADAADGRVRAAVVDDAHLSLEHCKAITQNVTDGTVQWHGADLAGLVGRPVRLLFELEDAKLFAFRFVA